MFRRVSYFIDSMQDRYFDLDFEYTWGPNSKTCASISPGIIHRRQEMQIPSCPLVLAGQCSLTLASIPSRERALTFTKTLISDTL